MNEPFITYDTLTIGADLDPAGEPAAGPSGGGQLPSILARLPRVPIAPPQPRVRKRFDDAESSNPTTHLLDELDPPAAPAGAATSRTPEWDPAATIRFDTVAPYPVEPEAPAAPPTRRVEAPEPARATVPFEPISQTPTPAAAINTPPQAETLEDPWSAWLLNLEATIQPYSRWIALAAVVAALGLTIVLLRGGGGPIDPPEAAPQVSTEVAGSNLADTSTGSFEPVADATPWLTSEPAPAPFADESEAVAVGPVSAPRPAGHAMLTGELLPAETPRIADSTPNDSSSRTIR